MDRTRYERALLSCISTSWLMFFIHLFFMKTYNQCLVRTPLGPITIINCTHNPYHISIFSAYLQKKRTYNNKKNTLLCKSTCKRGSCERPLKPAKRHASPSLQISMQSIHLLTIQSLNVISYLTVWKTLTKEILDF